MQSPSMLVKSKDVQPLHVLGTQVRFLCEAHSTNNVWSLMEVTLPEDAGPPPHTHQWDEAYFVTEGGVVHGFSGASQRPARVLIFDAPAHADAFFKRVDREVKDLPRDLAKLLDIGDNTGIRFLQPA